MTTGDQYKKLLEASYLTDKDKIKAKAKEAGFKYDKNISTDENKVFKNRFTKDPLITMRGTTNLKDVGTDIMLGLGLEKYTNRFKDANKFVDKVKNKYGDKPLTGIGHSLGGSLIEDTNKNNRFDKVITLDKGVGLNGLFKTTNKNQVDVRARTDPVSLLSLTQNSNTKTIPNTIHLNPLYSHDLKHISRLNTI